MSRLHRLSRSPTAAPLENDDLLGDILLRLPPLPSSLLRASAVCKGWRSLVSDPSFSRRFRAHHRRNPPLLGCFATTFDNMFFQSTLEAPDHIPQRRFSFPIYAGSGFVLLGCRDGLVLTFHDIRKHLLVWDPVIGEHHRLEIPPGFDTKTNWIGAAVLRAGGDAQHFQIVLVGTSDVQHTLAVSSVYSSDIGVWGNLITVPLPSEDSFPTSVYLGVPAAMVGDSLYWLLCNSPWIIEFDLAREILALIPMPLVEDVNNNMRIMPAEGGGLCFLFLLGYQAQLWKRKTDYDGVASWVPGRSIQLNKLISVNPETERNQPLILGFAEENNVILLNISSSVFQLKLEPLQFKKLFESKSQYRYYPFEAIYTADTGIGGRHDGAELFRKASHNLSG